MKGVLQWCFQALSSELAQYNIASILKKSLSLLILPWSTCFDYKAINYDSCDGMPHMVAAHNTQDYDANETCSILFKTWL